MPENKYVPESELSTEEKISLWNQRFTAAESFQQRQVDTWNQCYNLYRSIKEKKDKVWKSNLNVATAFTVIETIMPRVMLQFFGSKFAVEINPGADTTIKEAKSVMGLIKSQFKTMGAFLKFYEGFKSAFMYGTGIIKVFWRFETKRVVRTQNILKRFLGLIFSTGKESVEQEVITYDDPDIESVNIYDFFVDPNATSIKTAKYVIHRVFSTIDDLYKKQEMGIYSNVENVYPDVAAASAAQSNEARVSHTGAAPAGIAQRDELITLWECWTDERLIVIANKNTIIRDAANPFQHGLKPFIELRDTLMPKEFYGIGELEPIVDLIKERNELRNFRMDNVKTIGNRKYLYNRNADIDINELEDNNRPGGLIGTDDMNALRALEETDVKASISNEDFAVSRDISEASAMNETTIGQTPRRGESATAIAALSQASNNRFGLKTELMAYSMIELIKMMIDLNIQFMDRERKIKVNSRFGKDEYETVIGNNISGNYEFDISAGISQMKDEILRSQWLQLMSTWLMHQPNMDIVELQKETLRLFEVDNSERFIKPTSPQEQEMMSRQAAQGAEAGGTPSPSGVPSMAGVSTPAISN